MVWKSYYWNKLDSLVVRLHHLKQRNKIIDTNRKQHQEGIIPF